MNEIVKYIEFRVISDDAREMIVDFMQWSHFVCESGENGE